jgi:hypothetical protein
VNQSRQKKFAAAALSGFLSVTSSLALAHTAFKARPDQLVVMEASKDQPCSELTPDAARASITIPGTSITNDTAFYFVTSAVQSASIKTSNLCYYLKNDTSLKPIILLGTTHRADLDFTVLFFAMPAALSSKNLEDISEHPPLNVGDSLQTACGQSPISAVNSNRFPLRNAGSSEIGDGLAVSCKLESGSTVRDASGKLVGMVGSYQLLIQLQGDSLCLNTTRQARGSLTANCNEKKSTNRQLPVYNIIPLALITDTLNTDAAFNSSFALTYNSTTGFGIQLGSYQFMTVANVNNQTEQWVTKTAPRQTTTSLKPWDEIAQQIDAVWSNNTRLSLNRMICENNIATPVSLFDTLRGLSQQCHPSLSTKKKLTKKPSEYVLMASQSQIKANAAAVSTITAWSTLNSTERSTLYKTLPPFAKLQLFSILESLSASNPQIKALADDLFPQFNAEAKKHFLAWSSSPTATMREDRWIDASPAVRALIFNGANGAAWETEIVALDSKYPRYAEDLLTEELTPTMPLDRSKLTHFTWSQESEGIFQPGSHQLTIPLDQNSQDTFLRVSIDDACAEDNIKLHFIDHSNNLTKGSGTLHLVVSRSDKRDYYLQVSPLTNTSWNHMIVERGQNSLDEKCMVQVARTLSASSFGEANFVKTQIPMQDFIESDDAATIQLPTGTLTQQCQKFVTQFSQYLTADLSYWLNLTRSNRTIIEE